MFFSRKHLFISVLICISTFSFSQSESTLIRNIKQPYNIKDYFLLLPDSILKVYDTEINLHQRLLSLKYNTLENLWNNDGYWILDTLDYRNGYLKLSSTGDGAGTIFEITYFIKKNKTREIAVNKIYWDLGMSFSVLNFYEFKNLIWRNITKEVLPPVKLSDFTISKYAELINSKIDYFPVVYKLPQKGKNIKAEIDPATIDNLFDENKIDKNEYVKIKESLHKLVLLWKDGIFIIQK